MKIKILFPVIAVLAALVLLGCDTSTTPPVPTPPMLTAANPAGGVDYVSTNIGTLKYIPAGRFQRDNKAPNISIISSPYRMSQYEITRAQFMTLLGTDPSVTYYSSGTSDPVQGLNWYHAIAFCNKLSLAEGLSPVYAVTGVDFKSLTYPKIPLTDNSIWDTTTATWTNNGYRLPTEMEWLWAAMGAPADGQSGATNTTGYKKAFSGSTGTNEIGSYAVFGFGSWEKGSAITTGTKPVGSKLPNELGLYDMSGNVFEWCWDWYDGYPAGTQTDYRGSTSGPGHIATGGCWDGVAANCIITNRGYGHPGMSNWGAGFRVVRP